MGQAQKKVNKHEPPSPWGGQKKEGGVKKGILSKKSVPLYVGCVYPSALCDPGGGVGGDHQGPQEFIASDW